MPYTVGTYGGVDEDERLCTCFAKTVCWALYVVRTRHATIQRIRGARHAKESTEARFRTCSIIVQVLSWGYHSVARRH